MPMTVITLKSVPQSLKGDLTRWMQEIATGVYVGNFNSRIREYLWQRIKETMGNGEASMCFAARNEFGYDFLTENTLRSVIDYDGLPLVFVPKEKTETAGLLHGFSNAAKFHHAHNVAAKGGKEKLQRYVVVAIATDGLDAKQNHILEIGAIRCEKGNEISFNEMIACDVHIHEDIAKITGINDLMLQKFGKTEGEVLAEFRKFVGEDDIVGYHVNLDIDFLNQALGRHGLGYINSRIHDLLPIVKKEQKFQENYKLETSLESYGIHRNVSHRALEKAGLIKCLVQKLNKF